jgi:dihydrofolate synthase/folylpolyglutamate synthase
VSFSEIQSILDDYVLQSKKLHGDDLTIERMWPLLEKLGKPQQKLSVIHIAGTSGKTSTAYYCASFLHKSGFRVGLTVSPHIDSILERIQINLEPISRQEFEVSFSKFYGIVKQLDLQVSYFELLVAYELWYFARAGVDYAVIETGMGGLHDATNVLQRADKVCIITDIGFDHMHVLGSTLSAIASQKAGIIHAGSAVFMYEKEPECMKPILDRAREKNANLNVVRNSSIDHTVALPLFQQRNRYLALQAVAYLAKRDGFVLRSVAVEDVAIPARMEIVQSAKGKVLIMDGAHNPQKIQAFVESFQDMYGDVKVPVLLALKKGKDFEAIVDALAPIVSECIVTTFTSVSVASMQAHNPLQLQKYLQTKKSIQKVYVEQDVSEALKLFLAIDSPVCVVTGSFYLIAEIRAMLKKTSVL